MMLGGPPEGGLLLFNVNFNGNGNGNGNCNNNCNNSHCNSRSQQPQHSAIGD